MASDLKIFYQTVGEWLQGILGASPYGYSAHWPLEAAVATSTTLGYLSATITVSSEGEPFLVYTHVCLGAPVEEPVGVRHAFLSGAGAIGNAIYLFNVVEFPWDFADADAYASTMADLMAQLIDHATTGSAEEPIKKFISCAAERIWTWSFIIPVASDSEWLVAQFNFRVFRSGITGEEQVEGHVVVPSSSNQVSYPAGADPASLQGIRQAIEDGNHKTTVVGFNDRGGPLWAMESSEIIEGPEE